MVYVLTNSGINVFTDDKNVVFWDATNKGGQLVIKDDEVSLITNISMAVAVDYYCAGVSIKRSYHHPRLYFLDAIQWFLGPWSDKHVYTSYSCLNRVFPCRYRDKCSSFADIVIFKILSMNVCVHVCWLCLCYDLSPKLSAPVVGRFYFKF